MKSWLWNFLIKLLQSLSRSVCFLWVAQAALGLVCSCQMGGCLRAPKSWFLGTLERPCCPPQLLSVVMLMAAAAGLFRAPLISCRASAQMDHTFPQHSCLLASHLSSAGALLLLAQLLGRVGWACFDGSACAAVSAKSLLQTRQHGHLKQGFLLC